MERTTIRRRNRRRRRAYRRDRLIRAALLLALVVAVIQAAGSAVTRFPTTSAQKKENSLPSRQTKNALIDAPFIDQREKWPNGCESVSAVMALQYFGSDITVDEFIDGFLPQGDRPCQNSEGVMTGCDPRKAFSGDPRSEDGWGCCAPVIAKAVKAVIGNRSLPLSVRELEGVSLRTLSEEYTDKGIPVILWATIGMEPPQPDALVTIEETGEQYQWYYPMHCLLLLGKKGEDFYFNDPLAGKAVCYKEDAVEAAYTGLGSQAVVILPESQT